VQRLVTGVISTCTGDLHEFRPGPHTQVLGIILPFTVVYCLRLASYASTSVPKYKPPVVAVPFFLNLYGDSAAVNINKIFT